MMGVKYVGWCIAAVAFCTVVLWQNASSETENTGIIPEADPRDTIWVPDDYNTIQAGIDACPRGGTVMVRPGTYPENVSFNGRPLQLMGLEGADSTFIEAPNHSQPGIYFDADDEYVSRIDGFTVRGGEWGIRCQGQHSQPYRLYIVDNVVEYNAGGMGLHAICAWVQGNIIRYNFESGGLATIAEPMIVQNTIVYNWGLEGGGLNLYLASANPTIGGSSGMGNVIADNVSTWYSWGHDIYRHVPSGVVDATYNTWSVYPPTEFVMYPLSEFDTTGGMGPGRIDYDVYVSPSGDNNNSGLDPSHPLRNIHRVIGRLIPPSVGDPRTIHLLPGTYSFASNEELFPILLHSNVTITGTSADSVVVDAFNYAGGFWARECDNVSFSYMTIRNSAAWAIQAEDGVNLEFRNLNLHHNDSGIWLFNDSFVTIRNCLFAYNDCGVSGAGILMQDCYVEVINSTFYGNVAGEYGGGIACFYSGEMQVLNCILWNNDDAIGYGDIYGSAIPVITVTYTDIEQGWTAVGNISLNPMFVDTTEFAFDFHLQPGSPCIDAGNPAPVYNDPDGSRNDMGVYGGPGAEGWVKVPDGVESSTVPYDFGIVGIYPNPANPRTTVHYYLPAAGFVRFDVYNVLGRRAMKVIDNYVDSGKHEVIIDGRMFGSGIYFCRLVYNMPGMDWQVSTRKLLFVR